MAPVDLSRLDARRRRQQAERQIQETAQAAFIAAAGDRAAVLSLSEEWHVWEDHVRPLLQEDERQAKVLEAELLNPFAAGDQVSRMRTPLMYLKGRIDARRQDLELLTELVRRGEAAKASGAA